LKTTKNILVAVLNWGLGHATRCIPIIDELERQGAHVILASDGDALLLLQQKYPHLKTIELPAYNIHYKGNNMFLNIAPQIPKILKAIRLERKKLDSIIKEHKITTIISDNRYGMYHKDVYSIFVTHQLNIQVPSKLLGTIVAKCNHYFIQKYDECWVPDTPTEPSLAGILSHQAKLKNVHYIGALSRMSLTAKIAFKRELIVILSGPEPQRTYWEEQIIEQAQQLPFDCLIVGGKPKTQEKKQLAANVDWQSFMNEKELQAAILESKVVVARSGYSTIMDLVALECDRVLLVPTPGQTEQEYLAKRFAEMGIFACQTQENFSLAKGVDYLVQKEIQPRMKLTPVFLEKIILNCLLCIK